MVEELLVEPRAVGGGPGRQVEPLDGRLNHERQVTNRATIA
jgi:hypothetical protein